MSERDAIWHVPLLILAGIAALLGIGAAVATAMGAFSREVGTAITWGLAGASLTFTAMRIAVVRRVTRRELELVLLGGAVLVVHHVL